MAKSSVKRNEKCYAFWTKSGKRGLRAEAEEVVQNVMFSTPNRHVATFVTFGQKSIAFPVTFYTTFQHGALW